MSIDVGSAIGTAVEIIGVRAPEIAAMIKNEQVTLEEALELARKKVPPSLDTRAEDEARRKLIQDAED